eukprot:CAMPEP_0119539502 /NCGR_PEP_ID=MMETSP1344-20130328/51632_1 /TAXON_ID=236787 /ORGANISM="Florenciella parvula, Strain CCMP2471" /LENGTH=69 /DNA_ID=CAMNT_0007582817 /DNA_START=28 /DNA_END=234 /DNA_ORIENTATION=+
MVCRALMNPGACEQASLTYGGGDGACAVVTIFEGGGIRPARRTVTTTVTSSASDFDVGPEHLSVYFPMT